MNGCPRIRSTRTIADKQFRSRLSEADTLALLSQSTEVCVQIMRWGYLH